MRILITGASGFIGSYLLSALLKMHELYAIGTRKGYDNVRTISGEAIPYKLCDYSVDGLCNIIKELKPDAVVNLAAQRPKQEYSSLDNYLVNLPVAANVYEGCFRNGIDNIIDISTRMVYSEANQIPWLENDAIVPESYYALSKQLTENVANYYNQKGLHIKTLRLAQVIGLGEREGYVLQVYLKNAMHGLPIKVYGQCKGKRHYIYAKDVCRAIEAALALPEESGIYNIGMARIYGFDEIANTVNNVFGGKSKVVYDKDAKADESVYHMSIEKAKTKIFWQPQYNLYEAYLDMKNDIELHSLS